MTTATRVAIYCRVSTSAQEEDGTSLDTQEERCRAYASERGWQVVAVEREIHTGADLFGRPRLTVLRQTLQEGGAEVLLAYALDRLSRNQTHVAIIAEEVEAAGAGLAFVTEDFDKGPVGTFIRGAKAFAAELEREKIRERSMRGREQRVRSGRPLPSTKPLFGHVWHDERGKDNKPLRARLIEDPATAPIVRRVFAEALAGRTIRSIARGLTADGIPTPMGHSTIWRTATVHKMLKNVSYTGQMYGLRTRSVGSNGHRRDVPVPLDERIALPDGTVPALVDADTFAAIAAQLTANQARATRNNKHPEDALLRSGFARCGYCGNTLVAIRYRRESRVVYRCNTTNRDRHGCPHFSIETHELDTAVWDTTRAVLLDRTLIAREVERMRNQDPSASDVAAIDRRISEIDRQRQNLTKRLAMFDDDESAAPLVVQMANLAKQRRHHESEREALLAQHAHWEAMQTQLDDLSRWCDTVAVNLDHLDYAGKRLALEALGIGARVYTKDHQPRYEITAKIALPSAIASTASW